jgi:predicted RNA binding protein YcfA (HicA-like mRNA interferase family)
MQYNYQVTAKQVIDKLKGNGWTLDRASGSHHIFVKTGRRSVAVPFQAILEIWQKES